MINAALTPISSAAVFSAAVPPGEPLARLRPLSSVFNAQLSNVLQPASPLTAKLAPVGPVTAAQLASGNVQASYYAARANLAISATSSITVPFLHAVKLKPVSSPFAASLSNSGGVFVYASVSASIHARAGFGSHSGQMHKPNAAIASTAHSGAHTGSYTGVAANVTALARLAAESAIKSHAITVINPRASHCQTAGAAGRAVLPVAARSNAGADYYCRSVLRAACSARAAIGSHTTASQTAGIILKGALRVNVPAKENLLVTLPITAKGIAKIYVTPPYAGISKINDLREHLINSLPVLAVNPEQLIMYVERGRIEFWPGEGLSHAYKMQITVALQSWRYSVDAVTISLLEWVKQREPGFDPRNALRFETNAIEGESFDLIYTLDVAESVSVYENAGMRIAKHILPELKKPTAYKTVELTGPAGGFTLEQS